MKILLITPPMIQVNSPYPATAYLKAYLSQRNYQVQQDDWSLKLFLRIFSRSGLDQIAEVLSAKAQLSDREEFFLEAFDEYRLAIEPSIRFLQGKDPALALRINAGELLPRGPRFLPLEDHPELLEGFGNLGVQDRAKYLASLMLDDIADLIKEAIDPHFELSRYGESLASSQISLQPLLDRLAAAPSLIDQWMDELVREEIARQKPDLIGFSLPFPGNVYSALRASRWIKQNAAGLIVWGGGFVNTELRRISDPRLFDYVDRLVFDDGEEPLERIIESLKGQVVEPLRWIERDQHGSLTKMPAKAASGFKNLPTPDYSGLPLTDYVSMLEMPNSVHRLWSEYRWNKMILAHGCYWKRCTFCDISLDYIGRFEPAPVDKLLDGIERIIKDTGQSGFHFVDEAAPPALLRQLSNGIIDRGLSIVWWGNLRFDPQFDDELAQLMARAGCVAVTGGLEVASPRILELINKGITLPQVTKVLGAFQRAGIGVHAYLMYGFPSQTAQETIDSLEVVRRLFKRGLLQSAFWHRFVATVHSPVGKSPAKYGIRLLPPKVPMLGRFAENGIEFVDSVPTDHAALGEGLRRALYNYMHGVGLDTDVRKWFEIKVPRPTLDNKLLLADTSS